MVVFASFRQISIFHGIDRSIHVGNTSDISRTVQPPSRYFENRLDYIRRFSSYVKKKKKKEEKIRLQREIHRIHKLYYLLLLSEIQKRNPVPSFENFLCVERKESESNNIGSGWVQDLTFVNHDAGARRTSTA